MDVTNQCDHENFLVFLARICVSSFMFVRDHIPETFFTSMRFEQHSFRFLNDKITEWGIYSQLKTTVDQYFELMKQRISCVATFRAKDTENNINEVLILYYFRTYEESNDSRFNQNEIRNFMNLDYFFSIVKRLPQATTNAIYDASVKVLEHDDDPTRVIVEPSNTYAKTNFETFHCLPMKINNFGQIFNQIIISKSIQSVRSVFYDTSIKVMTCETFNINCPCQSIKANEDLILCQTCASYQHCTCMGIFDSKTAPLNTYHCHDCVLKLDGKALSKTIYGAEFAYFQQHGMPPSTGKKMAGHRKIVKAISLKEPFNLKLIASKFNVEFDAALVTLIQSFAEPIQDAVNVESHNYVCNDFNKLELKKTMLFYDLRFEGTKKS